MRQSERQMSILFAFLASSNIAFSQKAFFAGVNGTVYYETRTAKVYGPGFEERKSRVVNGSVGTRFLFMPSQKLKAGIGLSYLNRRYDMSRPFDHCYFNEPGAPCEFILAHVDQYNYKTIEIPLSLDFQFWTSTKWKAFAGLTWSSAYIVKATYHAKIPDLGTLEDERSLKLFSTSLIAQLTGSYQLNSRLALNAQPFMRIVNSQHGDPILFEQSSQWTTTRFDSFGLIVEAQIRLSE
jgi:hypothetical protein